MTLKCRVLLAALAGLFVCVQSFAQDDGSSIAPTSGGGSGGESAGGAAGGAAGGGVTGGGEGAGAAGTGAEAAGGNVATGATGAEAAEPVFISGGYGEAPMILQPGAGRFADKPLKFQVNVGIGYDDNTLTTPDKIPPVPTPFPTPKPVPTPTPPVWPPQPTPTPTPKSSPTPETPEQIGKTGSLFYTVGLGVQWSMATERTVMALDLGVGENYYLDRPGDQVDYTGHLSLSLQHKLTPRITLSAGVSSSYQSQPDFSLINAPTRSGSGDYLSTSGQLSLSYRATARVSAVTTYSYGATSYRESDANNNQSHTIGEALRYQFSQRATLVGEYRVSKNDRTNQVLNTSSTFVLAGLDMFWSQRLRTTLRLGGEVRAFENSTQSSGDDSTTTPRMEFTAYYVYGKGSTVSWSSTYGQDQSDSLTSKRTSLRNGVSVNHVFTARMSGFCALNWNHEMTTYDDQLLEDLKNENIQLSLGVQYLLTSNLTFSLSYTRTQVLSNDQYQEYRRNITTLSANYLF